MTVYVVVISAILLNIVLYHAKGTDPVRKITFILCGAVLFFVSAFRYRVGTDYVTYMNGYRAYTNAISWLQQPAVNIIAIVSKFIHDDYATWFFIMAIIAIVPVIYIIIKKSERPEIAIFLFVCLGCWHFSFNIVKQCAAAAILLCGYSSLVEKDFKKWVLYCLIASMFHFSGLLMVPVYFLVNIKPSLKLIAVFLGIGIALLLFYDKLFDLASFLKQGRNLVEVYGHTRNDSVNIIRVLVNISPGVLAFLYRKNLDLNDKGFTVLLNMSLLNMALNIGAMNSIYLYRICVFTNVFNILFIPALLTRIKAPDRIYITLIMIVLFIIFWWHDLSVGSSLSEFHWIFER